MILTKKSGKDWSRLISEISYCGIKESEGTDESQVSTFSKIDI